MATEAELDEQIAQTEARAKARKPTATPSDCPDLNHKCGDGSRCGRKDWRGVPNLKNPAMTALLVTLLSYIVNEGICISMFAEACDWCLGGVPPHAHDTLDFAELLKAERLARASQKPMYMLFIYLFCCKYGGGLHDGSISLTGAFLDALLEWCKMKGVGVTASLEQRADCSCRRRRDDTGCLQVYGVELQNMLLYLKAVIAACINSNIKFPIAFAISKATHSQLVADIAPYITQKQAEPMRVLTYDGEGIMHIGRSLGQNGARGYKNAAQKFMVLHMWVHLGHGLVGAKIKYARTGDAGFLQQVTADLEQWEDGGTDIFFERDQEAMMKYLHELGWDDDNPPQEYLELKDLLDSTEASETVTIDELEAECRMLCGDEQFDA